MTINYFGKILLCITLINGVANGHNCKEEPKCTLTRSHGMKAADCYNRDFKVFPRCVATDVEVLELSYNRLRKISRSEVKQFSGLRILYLAENFLSNLDDDTFVDLQYINVLDLSMNGITTFPVHIFQLPSLEKLYLRQNLNMNLDDALEKIKPILSPLTFLDISFTTEEANLPEFPDFGIMPFIHTLNITGNMYSLILPRHFAGFCRMGILITDNVTAAFDNPCDCWRLNDWLMQRNVVFRHFTCPGIKRACANLSVSLEDLRVYADCKAFYEKHQSNVMMKRVFIGLGSTISVLLFVLILYFFVFQNNICAKRREEKEFKNIAARAALLNERSRRNAENIYVL